MAVWHSVNVVMRNNEVTLRWARLVLGWVTVLLRGYTVSVCNQPTQPPTHNGMVNKYRPKGCEALRLVSKGRYGSFHLWIKVWMAGKTMWSHVCTVARAIPERLRDERGSIKHSTNEPYFTLVYFLPCNVHSPCLKPTSFTNPTPLVSLLPPGLPPRTFACTVSSELLGFYFIFSLFFVFGPCARLSWPSRQLLSAR